MSRLEKNRPALLVAFPEVSTSELIEALENADPDFASFVIEHGLEPTWHERTGGDAFRDLAD